MTIGNLIDFYLKVRTTGQLLGFDSLYSGELEALKQKIQESYGTQKAWMDRSESEELPEDLARLADDLVEKYDIWRE